MAIGTPSESPAIVTIEIDLSGVVPNVQSTTGVYVGDFRWGPVNTPTRVANETELAAKFGSPTKTNTIDFHTAAYYMRYSSDTLVVREVDSAVASNAFDSDATITVAGTSADSAEPTIKNLTDFDNQQSTLNSLGHTFVAKYPGALGNALSIEMCLPDSAAQSSFDDWDYADKFDAAPATSDYAKAKGAENDEMHIAVVDRTGAFTGTKGTVLETFPFVSVAKNAKNNDGSTNYAVDIVNNASGYVWMVGFDSDLEAAGAGADATDTSDFLITPGDKTPTITLGGASESESLTVADVQRGFDTIEDVDAYTVDFLIAPGMNDAEDQKTVVNDLVSIAATTRKDCVVVASPAREDVINNTDPTTDIVANTNGMTKSSYLFMDNNYLKVYDKYNDQYIHIPAASSTAGLMAATDFNQAPWFSPAGQRRGQYLGITDLAWSPTKTQRDTLYKAGINPVANIPGQGILLFGDKTKLARPSAFDRINVRRLFLVVERAISLAARNVMFEFNDEFTRAEFVNIVEPFLREIKGRRGITDFRVVCDETNNTAAVIDRNEFIANIFIKPARSINYVTLNFVAVRTGVEFEEVVGTV